MNIDGAPILDQAVLAELRVSMGDDDEFMRELVETYVDEGRTSMDGLLAAAAALDCAAIVRPAHTLKSTSASLGAMRLSAICREIEAAGREARTDTLVEDSELARETWDATLAAFAEAGLHA
jgi:HPt (histidine-containing phosphotransfer) domain-containing protein